MEGVASEASSYAVKQNLDKLIVLYDSNAICLDGETKDAFTENIRAHYEAYGWHTSLVEDGNNLEAIELAIAEAKSAAKPSPIEVKTVIGFGAPTKGGTDAVHGAPLGSEEAAAARENIGWSYGPFEIPEEVYTDFKENVATRDSAAYDNWENLLTGYRQAYPELAQEVDAIHCRG